MIERIFKDLGTRLSRENQLSDITWAFCENCPGFKNIFLELFQFQINEPLDISREAQLGDGSRIDFFIKSGEQSFLIENKIYDTNYHIEQYAASPEGKIATGIGLLINHTMDSTSKRLANDFGFKLVTWENFIKLLERRIDSEFNSDESILIRAYISYVKEVCSIMEFKEIRFENLTSLFYLNNLIIKTIQSFQGDGLICELYSAPTRAFGPGWSGQYFSLKHEDNNQAIWPFFGIVFEPVEKISVQVPLITIEFEDDWCRKVYSKLKNKNIQKEYFNIVTRDDLIECSLPSDKFKEFEKSSLEHQEKILSEFFNKVIEEIITYI